MRGFERWTAGALVLALALPVLAADPEEKKTPAAAAEPPAATETKPATMPGLESPAQQYSYVVGYQVARSVAERMASQGVDFELDAFQIGFRDSIMSAAPQVTQEQVLAAIASLQANRTGEMSKQAEENLARGRQFLSENAKKEGVVVLASGLQYSEIKAGTGTRPKSGATVLVHYHGSSIDGQVFDSSVERGEPAKFATGSVIPGFREALTNMREGAKWRVFIPSELAYGERGAGAAIGPNETLVFELELIEVLDTE